MPGMTATALFFALAVILHAWALALAAWLTRYGRHGQRAWALMLVAILISGVQSGLLLLHADELGDHPELGVSAVLVGGLLSLAMLRIRPVITELSHKARRHESTERKFRAFFEELPVGVALTEVADKHTKLVEHNKALTEFLGLGTGTGAMSIDSLAHPDDLEEGAARLARLANAPHTQLSHEQRFILGDGRVAWGLVTTTALDGEGGKPTHFISALQDITERKRAEEALREERDRANTILDVAEVVLISTDIQGVVLSANRKAETVLGIPAEEIVGKKWLDLGFSETSRTLAEDLLHALVDGETSVSPAFEGTHTSADGSTRVVAWRCAAVRDDAGSIVGTLCSGIDVTTRSEAVTRFRQERGRVASIMETSPIAIVVVDRRGRLIYANQEAEEMLGSLDTTTGRTFIEQAEWKVVDWAGRDVPFEQLPFGHVLRSNQRLRDGRYGLLWPDGRHKRMLVNITPLEEESHGVSGVVATLRDVSGALELDAQARRAERMDAIRRLALGAAHDFNNVLTAIIGTAEMGLVDPTGPRGRFETILKSAIAAAELTDRLQSIGSLKPLSPLPLRMSELADAALSAAHASGEEGALEDTLEPHEAFRVAADRAALEVVIAALLRNAREAAGPQGHVQLTTALRHLRDSEHPGKYVEIAVIDSGPGVPPEVRDRMFEPYFSTRAGRPGLGLSEALSVVTRLGGHFEVSDDTPTRVAFRLPITDLSDTPSPPPERRTMDELPRGQESVLVVEDEEEVEFLLRMVLERQGYHVVSAGSLTAARAEAKKMDRLDLLLTDVHLPDGTGTELAAHLRSRHPRLPVLFTSGMAGENVDTELEGDAYTEFIAKPFTVRSIAHGVRAALDA
ncbi:MAG: PAS domain-containing sensor histidine kinase [Deltaproteobacteria bacterium]|nr:MAG: PAS domain-containing sensor histidine kinase [Deltaproteobacteria bacterium]